MNFVKDYMLDEELRHELNDLTLETFGFSFEGWVTGGYFEGDYIPYSYEKEGQLIANISANRMKFLQNGEEKNYIQLGTVMTKEAYRNQGLAADLLKQVIAEYEGKCDGIYLYGNLDALGFYDKQGFVRGMQYRYYLKDDAKALFLEKSANLQSTDYFYPVGENHKERYQEAVRKSAVNSAFEQLNKFGLQMFYTADMEQIYYCETLDCFIAMEKQENTLFLQSIICTRRITLEEILSHIQEKYDTLILEFTPKKEDEVWFGCEAYDGEDDYRFFYLGEELKSIEGQKLYFPTFSHA